MNLLQIQKARFSADENRLKQAQQAFLQAESVLNERTTTILTIKKDINNTYDYMSYKDSSSYAERISRGDAYLFWLNYDLEMHEYYLAQEEERLNETKNEYIIAKQHWYKQKTKIDKLNEMYLHNKKMINAENEESEEESNYESKFNNGNKDYG
jgi:hypothetical protein